MSMAIHNAIDAQKAVADKVLQMLFPIDPYAIVAGGAPRDWYMGNAAKDVDVFFNVGRRPYWVIKKQLEEVGISNFIEKTGEGIPENYKANPNLRCVFDVTVDGIQVQIMAMECSTFQVVEMFPFSICQVWYKNGKIETDPTFRYTVETKSILMTQNEVYGAENKYTERLKKKFPEPEWKWMLPTAWHEAKALWIMQNKGCTI